MNERERKEVDAVIEQCRGLLARLEKLPGDTVIVRGPPVGLETPLKDIGKSFDVQIKNPADQSPKTIKVRVTKLDDETEGGAS